VADLSGPRDRGPAPGVGRPSNKQIGEELGLSALTVKSHLARIARKLGTGDRAEMVAMAMRGGVIR
jgi:DNA-binding NarL/FixJ family response regulator